MAKTPLFTPEEAIAEFERCRESIDRIRDAGGSSIAAPDVCHAFGTSLIHHVYSLCEVVLHYVCCEKATIDGTEDWPRIKDLLKKGGCVDAPADVRASADAMDKIKKECDKNYAAPEDIELFFSLVSVFLNWAIEVLGNQDRAPGYRENAGLKAALYLKDFIGAWGEAFEIEKESPLPPNAFSLIYLGKDADIDSMSDEELDRIYRRRRSNKRDSLLPVYILQILKDHSGIDNRLHTKGIIDYLESEYEIHKSRKVVENCLNTFLNSGDFYVWRGIEKGSGYWYSEEDENLRDDLDDIDE